MCRPRRLHPLQPVLAFNVANLSSTAGLQVHPETLVDHGLEALEQVDSSRVDRGPNIPHARRPEASLPAVLQVDRADAQALALVQALADRDLVASADHDPVDRGAPCHLRAKLRAHNALHRAAADVASSSTPKPRKAR